MKIIFPPETPSAFLAEDELPLDLVYEDDVVLIVNKPAGIPVIPSQLYPSGTLANGLLYLFSCAEFGVNGSYHQSAGP
ncbi:similar to ribosomal large subunit pseudouridine synthase D [Sporolactobacillus inulinus]|uniref:Similar to ribosomal large subunit pseudouridine synthase D n=1 Tax=Sporolactobacillus inulinus TaxID=2078 RepID=A0A4Y1Z9X7_9BACL|nr:similar to ribosomal large subunit pseudouridine synthase D [Sporolactobacillus inulinus]